MKRHNIVAYMRDGMPYCLACDGMLERTGRRTGHGYRHTWTATQANIIHTATEVRL